MDFGEPILDGRLLKNESDSRAGSGQGAGIGERITSEDYTRLKALIKTAE